MRPREKTQGHVPRSMTQSELSSLKEQSRWHKTHIHHTHNLLSCLTVCRVRPRQSNDSCLTLARLRIQQLLNLESGCLNSPNPMDAEDLENPWRATGSLSRLEFKRSWSRYKVRDAATTGQLTLPVTVEASRQTARFPSSVFCHLSCHQKMSPTFKLALPSSKSLQECPETCTLVDSRCSWQPRRALILISMATLLSMLAG